MGYVLGDTIEVSQPVQVTSDNHYERGQAIVYDGSDYWLFYGRSDSVTGPYSSDTPDTHDYKIYYKKASTVAGLASATPTLLSESNNQNIYLGEISAAYYDGYVRVFASVDVGSSADLYQFYTNNGGSTWSSNIVVTGLPDGAAHHAVITCNGKLWFAYQLGNDWDSKYWDGSWSSEYDITTNYGTAKFYCEGTSLYFIRADSGDQDIHEWNGSSWSQIDSATESGPWDPTIYKIGNNYVCAYAPWDGTQQYIKGKVGTSLSTLLSSGSEVKITSGRYSSNPWVDMWPTGFNDTASGDTYLFYTSERNPDDPSSEIDGNIWYLPVDWDVNNDHYTYIQEAIDGASSGDTVSVDDGTYYEGDMVIDKSLTLQGSGRDDTIVNSTGFQKGFDIQANDTTIRDLSVYDTDGPGGRGITVYSSPNVIGNILVDNVKSSGNEKGLAIHQSYVENLEIINSIFSDNTGTGIRVDSGGTVDELTIRNCSADDNGGLGLSMYGPVTGLNITDTTFNNNGNATIDWSHTGIYGGNINRDFAIKKPIEIKNVEVNGNPRGLFMWIYGGPSLIIENVTANNSTTSNAYGIGAVNVYTTGTGNLTDLIIRNVIANDAVVSGILIKNQAGLNNLIIDNVETKRNNIGIYYKDYGNVIDNVIINNSDISENSDDGIYLNALRANIQNNKIHGNCDGIFVDSDLVDTSNIHINFNQIYNNNNCPTGVHNDATEFLDAEVNWWGHPSGPTHTSNPIGMGDNVSDNVDYRPWCMDPECIRLSNDSVDFGDAPDSTNSYSNPMNAYLGILGNYPSVQTSGSPPYGPCHYSYFAKLGTEWTWEIEADLNQDQDGVPNIDPLTDTSDQDSVSMPFGMDDGLKYVPINTTKNTLALPHCQMTTIPVELTITGTAMGDWTAYLNMWIDYNHDGDWGIPSSSDKVTCTSPSDTSEWVVQNYNISVPATGLSPATQTFNLTFMGYNPTPGNTTWLRVQLTPALVTYEDGSGPNYCYEDGETEDYYLETWECVHDVDCDDGLWCTENDTCVAGVCVYDSRDCSDGNECTDSVCNETSDSCVNPNLPSGTLCGQARNCSDTGCYGDFVQVYPADGHDTCDGLGNCSQYSCDMTSEYCSDNDPFDGINSWQCGASCDQDSDCDDGNVTTLDECSLGSCTCLHTPVGCTVDEDCTQGGWYDTGTTGIEPEECRDIYREKWEYRDYYCNVTYECAYNVTDYELRDIVSIDNETDGTTCNDRNGCTENDECQGGFCVGDDVDCSYMNSQCIVGVCNSTADYDYECLGNTTIRLGKSCNDGIFCTINEVCNSTGDCAGGEPMDCSDGYTCTDDHCNNTLYTCVNAINDAHCLGGEICDPEVYEESDSGCGKLELNLTSPAEGVLYGNRNIQLTALANGKCEKMRYSDNGGYFKSLCMNCYGYNSPKTFSDGNHTLVVNASTDREFVLETVQFYVDGVNPIIHYTYPDDGEILKGTIFTVGYTEQNLNEITLYLEYNNTTYSKQLTGCPTGSNKQCSTDYDLTAYNGDVLYYFVVEDLVNSVRSDNKTITIDNTNPTVNILLPENNTYPPYNIDVSVNVSEEVDYLKYSRNGVSYSTMCRYCDSYDGSMIYNYGTHTLYVKAIDYAGNEGQDQVTFVVASASTTTTTTVPTTTSSTTTTLVSTTTTTPVTTTTQPQTTTTVTTTTVPTTTTTMVDDGMVEICSDQTTACHVTCKSRLCDPGVYEYCKYEWNPPEPCQSVEQFIAPGDTAPWMACNQQGSCVLKGKPLEEIPTTTTTILSDGCEQICDVDRTTSCHLSCKKCPEQYDYCEYEWSSPCGNQSEILEPGEYIPWLTYCNQAGSCGLWGCYGT